MACRNEKRILHLSNLPRTEDPSKTFTVVGATVKSYAGAITACFMRTAGQAPVLMNSP
jgi:hypothetical protein